MKRRWFLQLVGLGSLTSLLPEAEGSPILLDEVPSDVLPIPHYVISGGSYTGRIWGIGDGIGLRGTNVGFPRLLDRAGHLNIPFQPNSLEGMKQARQDFLHEAALAGISPTNEEIEAVLSEWSKPWKSPQHLKPVAQVPFHSRLTRAVAEYRDLLVQEVEALKASGQPHDAIVTVIGLNPIRVDQATNAGFEISGERQHFLLQGNLSPRFQWSSNGTLPIELATSHTRYEMYRRQTRSQITVLNGAELAAFEERQMVDHAKYRRDLAAMPAEEDERLA